MNNYWDVSLPSPGGGRKTADFGAIYAVVLDDYGVKVKPGQAKAILGEPSYIIETSPGNFHAGWFTEGLTDRAWVHGMLRALYEALGRTGDNLVKPTTLVRLPVGTNGKTGLGAAGFRVKLIHWQPDNRIAHLDWPAIETRIGAVVPVDPRLSLGNAMPEVAAIEADLVLKVFRDQGMVRDHGRSMPFGWGFEVDCPWAAEHTDPRPAASYVPVRQRFKCHHGHCQDRTMADVRAWADACIREDSGGLESLASLEFDNIEPPIGPGLFHAGVQVGGAIDLWDQKTPPTWPGGVLSSVEEDDLADQVERNGLDAGALGAVTMTVYSGACDKRTILSPYASASWQIRPVLWTMLVDETGRRKTATLQARLGRLRQLNLERMRQYKVAQAHWQVAPKALRGPAPAVSAVLAEDVTPERLQELMAGNPRGLLYTRDELAGWFDFGRYMSGPGAAERAFFLEAYEGGPLTISRMTRTTVIENTAITLLGGIQQQKLAGLKGLEDDGLLSRMGVILERPTEAGVAKPGGATTRTTDATVDRLLAAGVFDDYRTDDAGEAMIRETEALARVLATRPGIGVGFRGFFRKMHGLQARTALVLHLVDGGQDPIIPADTVARAGRYVRFLHQHAEVFYTGLPGSADAIAQAIGSFILRKPIERITAGQLRRDIAGCRPLRSLREIQDAVFLLVIGGWLTPETNWPSNSAWRVRPGIRDQFAARIAVETERTNQIKEAMNQWGQYR